MGNGSALKKYKNAFSDFEKYLNNIYKKILLIIKLIKIIFIKIIK